MKEFPSILNISNKDNFKVISYNRNLCYLRTELYEHIIKEDENNYFDLEKFRNYRKIKDITDIDSMVKILIDELCILGWNCKISFGGTALFIYSSESPPVTCWDDGLI
jgi:hypothetical protein